MLFSTDTIKSALKHKADLDNNTKSIKEFTQEPFFTSAIEEDNWKVILANILVYYKNKLSEELCSKADQLNKKILINNKQFFDPECIRKVNAAMYNIDQLDLYNILNHDVYSMNPYDPCRYFLDIKKQIVDIKKYIEQVNYLLKTDKITDLEIYIYSEYNKTLEYSFKTEDEKPFLVHCPVCNDNIVSGNALLSMDIFNSSTSGKVLINNSAYITDYLNSLATSLRELPSLNFSDNLSAVIRSKIISVISLKIKLIDQVFSELANNTTNYIISLDAITKQDIAIFNYLLNPEKKVVIDASITDPQDDIEESVLFELLYSAYKEAYENNAELNSLTESVGLMALDEAANVNIMKYINKVTDSISKAWNSFKVKMEDLRKKAVSKFTNKFKQNAENLPDDLQFEVQNMPELDESKFNLLKVIPFNYQEMKEYRKSSDTFVAKYYPGLNKKEGESLKAAMEQFLTKSKNNIKVTKDYILNTVIPILEKGNTVAEQSVQTDMNTTNASTKTISLLSNNNNVAKVTTTTTTNNTTNVNNTTVDHASANVYAIIGEADGEGVKIVDDPGRTAAVDNRSILKDISVYISVSSTILSAKMKMIRQKELTAFKILAHAFTPPKRKKEEQQ